MPDQLTTRFASLASDVRERAKLRPVATVRAHGDRRRTRLTAVMTGVMATGAAGGLAGASALAGGAVSGDQLLPTHLPATFTLPHQILPGWSTDLDPRAPSADGLCAGAATLKNRTDARTTRFYADDRNAVEQVLLYESPDDARSVLSELAAGAGDCAWGVGGLPGDVVAGHRTDTAALPLEQLGPDDVTYYNLTAFRQGNALYLWYSKIDGTAAELFESGPANLMAAQDELCDEVGLCDRTVTSWCTTDLSPGPDTTPPPVQRVCMTYATQAPSAPPPDLPIYPIGSAGPSDFVDPSASVGPSDFGYPSASYPVDPTSYPTESPRATP